MKQKLKKKYKLGGYTTEQLFSTTDDGVTTDQNFGKDLGVAGAIYGTQTKVNNAVTGMALNSLGEGDDKDFAAQEAARMQKFQPLGVLGAGISMFGAGKRRKAFDSNLTQENLMDRNQTMLANDYSGYAQDARVTFAGGGNMGTNADQGLVEIEGPSHEENPYGGTPVGPKALLEGGETKKGNYVWSKRVLIPGKKTTFAKESKLIHKMYRKKRPEDPISIKAEERELGKLEQAQEEVRNTIMDKAYKKAYGGSMKKKMAAGGPFGSRNVDTLIPERSNIYQTVDPILKSISSNDFSNLELPNSDLTPINPPSQVPSKNYGVNGINVSGDEVSYNPDLFPDENFSYNPQDVMSDQEWKDSASNQIRTPQTDTSNNKFGMQPEDYASVGVQALSGLSQLYYGLKGPDKVRDAKFNLIRPNKVNLTAAKRLGSQEIDTAFNGVDYDIRGNATSTGSYLGNRLASGIKRAKSKGELLGRLGMEEANANAQIMNSVGSANAQILNQEEQINLGQEDKRIQEKDASRMAVTEGLNNIGQSFGQGVKDNKSYNMQKLKANWAGTKDIKMIDGIKYYKQSDGSYKPE